MPKLLLVAGDLESTQLLAGAHRRNAVVVEPFPAGGISAGAALVAVLEVVGRSEMESRVIVTISPSFAECYLSTHLFDGLGVD